MMERWITTMRGGRARGRAAWLLLATVVALIGVLVLAASATATTRLSSASERYADGQTTATWSSFGYLSSPLDDVYLKTAKSSFPLDFAPPASYDLRDTGKLTPVKDQGNYGTCWTFACFGSTESCLLPGEAFDFSENSMAWHSGYDVAWDEGGNQTMATAFLARWDGPVLETDDPYFGTKGPAPATLTKQKHLQEMLIVAPKQNASCDDIKNVLMNHGAIATRMNGDALDYPYWDASTSSSYYPASGTSNANHAVTIVGWNDNYPASNFETAPPGNGAFIVRNSWGPDWGDGGYFYASYYDKYIGGTNYCFSGSEPTSNYTGIYQYDPLGCIDFIGGESLATAWIANVFTATSSANVTAASTYCAYANLPYEVWAGPTKSSMSKVGSGTFASAGYHTVAFGSPLSVTSGQPFAVAFKLVGTATRCYLLPTEYQADGFSSRATASSGQSFYSTDGSTWSDFTIDVETDFPSANLCIKAFTGGGAPPTDPTISSLSVTSGKPGDTVVISGTNLGISGTVKFGSMTAATSTWTPSVIVCTVPQMAAGQVQVTVTTGGKTSNGKDFTVALPPGDDPAISSLSVSSGAPGDTIVINGAHLGSSGTVKFGSTTATTSTWTDVVIVCTVPQMAAGQVQVTVTTGGKTSNGLSFTVTGGLVHAPSTTASSEADLTTWHNHEVVVSFEVSDAGADATTLLYSVDGSAWEEMDLALYGALRFFAPADHSNDGDHALAFKARDAAGTVEAPEKTVHVMLDTARPAGKATVAVVVHRGHTATLKYRLNDALPNGGTASGVVVKIKNRYGQVVKTFKCGTKTVNKTYSLRFRCKLAKGAYRYYVSGTDAAGNLSTTGSNRLTVLR